MAAEVTLTPAYGRDYKSAKAAVADFEADKDFIFNRFGDRYDGAYVNKAQLIEEGVKNVRIRYKNKTQVTLVKVVEGTPIS